jgi:hypothetical protein
MDVEMGGTSPTDGGTVGPIAQEVHTSDRGELIQCIKRGQNPTWVPHRSVSAEDFHLLTCASSTSSAFWPRVDVSSSSTRNEPSLLGP